jgi:hypothetical protein
MGNYPTSTHPPLITSRGLGVNKYVQFFRVFNVFGAIKGRLEDCPGTAIKTWPCVLAVERSLRDVEGGMAAQLGNCRYDENRVRGKIDEAKEDA